MKNNRQLQNEKQELERVFDFNSADSLKKREKLNQCEKAGSRPRHADSGRRVCLPLDVIGWMRPSGFHRATY